MRTPSHDDPIIVVQYVTSNVPLFSFPVDREEFENAVELFKAATHPVKPKDPPLDTYIEIPDFDTIPPAWRGVQLPWNEVSILTESEDHSSWTLCIAIPKSVRTGTPAKVGCKVIAAVELIDALKELGVLPKNCRRCVIDLEFNKAAMLYFDTYADERLLAAFRSANLTPEIGGVESAN